MLVRASFPQSDSIYGAIWAARDLRDWGERPQDDGLRPEHSIAPNVLSRRFDAGGPNKKWVAEFTYQWTAEGWWS